MNSNNNVFNQIFPKITNIITTITFKGIIIVIIILVTQYIKYYWVAEQYNLLCSDKKPVPKKRRKELKIYIVNCNNKLPCC